MDKKMKRTIGYVQPKVIIQKKEDKEPASESSPDTPEKLPEPEVNVMDLVTAELAKAKKIVAWINSHKEFKWGVMCNKLGIEKGNFQRTLNAAEPKIKIEFISPIEDFLKEYGYAK